MEIQNWVLRIFRRPLRLALEAYFLILRPFRTSHIVLIWDEKPGFPGEDPVGRMSFYAPGAQRICINPDGAFARLKILFYFFSPYPILIAGNKVRLGALMVQLRPRTFNIDPRTNPADGWEWSRLSCLYEKVNSSKPDAFALERLSQRLKELKESMPNAPAYLLGTGPSLEAASQRSWNDGFRIVCNTIVRDAELFHHIQPHFIVAGDGIYHFGHTAFARAFRKDLHLRLKESKCLFVFPKLFWPIIRREMLDIKDQLIPIPVGNRRTVHDDLTKSFSLPALGNALALLLLPMGCTLSKRVCLWGFDGRAPGDTLFWSNSTKHSYSELMSSLLENHPAFFDHHVPKSDPFKYTRSVLGDELEWALESAENNGWQFEMMHHSWTPALSKRQVADSILKKTAQ